MATLVAGNSSGVWAVRGATFVLWALAAASAVAWGMKFSARPGPVSSAAVPARSAPPVDPQAVARLLGASPAAAAGPVAAAPVATLASRFTLVGVASQGRGGAALIAVDGKPPKPYRVGSQLDEGIVLQSVQGRKAVLASNGQPVLTLELPPPANANAAGGSMPAAGGLPGMAPGSVPAVMPGSMGSGAMVPVPGTMPGATAPVPAVLPGSLPGAQRPPIATPAPR